MYIYLYVPYIKPQTLPSLPTILYTCHMIHTCIYYMPFYNDIYKYRPIMPYTKPQPLPIPTQHKPLPRVETPMTERKSLICSSKLYYYLQHGIPIQANIYNKSTISVCPSVNHPPNHYRSQPQREKKQRRKQK